ncbi:N-acetylglucosaminyl-phosphatidylinositol biosynthetic protein [Hamiltosporidium tvaerminnensis]|uniref:N-acetylglucosaminyl-phosphatidylinositol biosynthetic protein n=1 Tax=Hamiltosporidium tvaerminnensis TaxID=1176355 RepID=A0A4Q9L6Z4_9MICR|nr:N-acetylglucosaminyl-phosphatidylinositol biosynthetic protein [Hamiltosporidium tvaerminnensis]
MIIAMVCDYFFPNIGGIETHIMCLSKELVKRNHKVIIITHSYDNYKDIHYLKVDKYNYIKVYYLSLPLVCQNTTFPSLFSNFKHFFEIFVSNEIEIVHGHQSMSNLSIEGVSHAITMGIPTVLTEHSIFETGGIENIIVNKLCEGILKNIGAYICVSYCCKENLIERFEIKKENKIFVIPNGVKSKNFRCKKNRNKIQRQKCGVTNFIHKNSKKIAESFELIKHEDNFKSFFGEFEKRIKIAVVSRLVYRKGVDLLIEIIPMVCSMTKNVDFVIVGNGNKRENMEQMIDDNKLHNRVLMLGELDNKNISGVLQRCQIFLNTSLTESFCMAIIEAVSSGLIVVSTNVGGIHEILPDEMIELRMTSCEDMVEGILKTVKKVEEGEFGCGNCNKLKNINEIFENDKGSLEKLRTNEFFQSKEIIYCKKCSPIRFHKFVKKNYNWKRIARKTENIYINAFKNNELNHAVTYSDTFGSLFRFFFRFLIIMEKLIYFYLRWKHRK